MALSFRWSDDRFAAFVAISTFISSLAMLWAASQLVRSWLRLRIVVAMTFGLLLAFEFQGFYYKFVQVPMTIETFNRQKTQLLTGVGMQPGSFIEKQFELKVHSGELMGFNSSPNSFAGMLVLCMILAAGVAIQREADHQGHAWAIPIILAEILATWLLVYTHSKAALVSPILAAAILYAAWRWRYFLTLNVKYVFWRAVAAIGALILLVIAHGLFWHRLPGDSLNFRWRYWIGSWRIFIHHPILGVGWDNFGLYYLRYRIPAASEEIRDPHNFIIRFFVELGIIGGFLMLAWLGRTWWELSQPITPPPPPKKKEPTLLDGVGWIAVVAFTAMGFNAIASIDFLQSHAYVFIEAAMRAAYAAFITIGAALAAMRWAHLSDLDDRPAPWILCGLLVALGVFLIHNLIEFSLFEAGPMCLFMVLVGSALGVRQPTMAGKKKYPQAAKYLLIAAAFIVVPTIMYKIIPLTRAEVDARLGDNFLRRGTRGDFELAAGDFKVAFNMMPINGDYAYRVGNALNHEPPGGGDIFATLNAIQYWYDVATATNPSDIRPYLRRAALAAQAHDADSVEVNFEQALELDPNEVDIRLQYADTLSKLHLPQLAIAQYEEALSFNDQLDKAEPKRLSPDKLAEINQTINDLKSAPSDIPTTTP
jgi:O-antigen ligase